MLRWLWTEYLKEIVDDALDWPKHYYVVSYIGDDQVGEKTRFYWLREARSYALDHHALMVRRNGEEVWTGIELGRYGRIVEWLIHKGHVARWPYPATHLADVISGRR